MDTSTRIEKTVKWLSDKVKETGTNGLVVGVSGGVDSAVVAFLAKKAMPDNSLGVILPCGSSGEDIEDAWKVVEACGIQAFEIDLTDIHQNLAEKALEKAARIKEVGNSRKKIASANLKARLRM
ncbi:MAG TPA: NAD(+) synthase, partial [Bacillota bacterium]|nr:NAD(+) synthase [Bacillota bacterium]